ncbi:hypothetical protein GCM10027037_21860 [Mucilaginibacter koreensis]
MKRTCFTLLFLLTSTLLFAQFKISGRVLNTADSKPLEGATVFVNNTSYGTKTDSYGNFVISKLRAGHYELVVSMVGFKSNKVSINVQADIKVPAILINERTTALNEVQIITTKKPENKYLDMFKQEILGTSKFGRQCQIMNPKVIQLNFDQRKNKLTGYTSDFMIIENQALGYRLKYLVEDFERNENAEILSYVGYVLFEEMQGSEQQRLEWKKKRLEAYTGSLQHFFRSVIGNAVSREEEPGFLVVTDTRVLNKNRAADAKIKEKISLYSSKYNREYRDSLLYWNTMFRQARYIEVLDTTKMRAGNLVQLTDQSGLYALKLNTDSNYIKKWGNISVPGVKGKKRFTCDTCSFKNLLYVTYIKNIPKKLAVSAKGRNYSYAESFTPTPEMDKMASLISVVDGHVVFDRNGVVVNPMSLKVERYWAGLRLGDLLPIDYQPDTDIQ